MCRVEIRRRAYLYTLCVGGRVFYLVYGNSSLDRLVTKKRVGRAVIQTGSVMSEAYALTFPTDEEFFLLNLLVLIKYSS